MNNEIKYKSLDHGIMPIQFLKEVESKVDRKEIHIACISLAYILIIERNQMHDIKMINKDVKKILQKYSNLYSVDLANRFKQYTSDELISFILFDNTLSENQRDNSITPEGVCRLAKKLLNIQYSDKVLELCSGKGTFLVELALDNKDFIYEGVECNPIDNEIAIIRNSILGLDAKFVLDDVLNYRTRQKANKIFANYPFALSKSLIHNYKNELCKIFNIEERLVHRISSDWIFNLLMMEQLDDNGKAVSIVTNGSVWNNIDKEVRKYFIENGYIEAIISLPDRIFYDTPIPTTMIVFSRNNQTVRMIDANKLYESGRRNNILTDKYIEKIMSLLDNNSEVSIVKTCKEIATNDYILYAKRYTQVLPVFKNGVEFGTLISKITRGLQLRASELDDLKSTDKTPYRHLMLSNIQNGIISFDDGTQYLTHLPDRFEKYCIQNNSIVLSKIGTQGFKSAVVKVDDDCKLLVNGNLFVIEIDETKANPYYIQAFISSDVGVTLLDSIYTGTLIRSLSVSSLEKMVIPLPSMEKQQQIADKYLQMLNEVTRLNEELRIANVKLHHVYDDTI